MMDRHVLEILHWLPVVLLRPQFGWQFGEVNVDQLGVLLAAYFDHEIHPLGLCWRHRQQDSRFVALTINLGEICPVE